MKHLQHVTMQKVMENPLENISEAYDLSLYKQISFIFFAKGMGKKRNTSRFAPSWRCFSTESWPPENAYLFICRYNHILLKIIIPKVTNIF